MKSTMKKTISVAVASAMVLSMASCSFLDKSKDEVLEAADEYAKNLASCSISKLAKLSNSDFEDIQEEWEAKLAFSEGDLYSADTAAALDAIADTISYEVDEESAEATKKSGEGSVDVTFTIADYESVISDDSITDADAFADAIGDADTKEISVTLEFEADDDAWLCSNAEDVFGDLYAFTDEEFSFVPPIQALLTADVLNWWWDDNGDDTNPVYTNTDEIDAELPIEGIVDPTGLSCEITCNGQVVYSDSDTTDCWAIAGDSAVNAQFVDPDTGYFIAGQYTVTFYDAEGSEIMSGTCNVILEAVATTTTTTTTTSSADPLVGTEYLTSSGDFYDETSAAVWFGADDNSIYASGTTVLELTIMRYDESLGEVSYEYFYSADGTDFTSLGSYSCSAVSYSDGDFYECQYTGSIVDGYYGIIVTYDGVDQVSSVCRVG